MNAIARVGLTASVDYPAFLKAMTNACRIVDRKVTVPVLSTVRLSASRDGLQICGTDLDVYTTTYVTGRVDASFLCLIDAHRTLSVLKKAKEAEVVNFTVDGERVVMTIGRLNVTLSDTMKPGDFPTEAKFRKALMTAACTFALPTATLAKALSKINNAISTEETRYYLNGVYLHVANHRLRMVSTDGHRLARYCLELPSGAESMPDAGVILPAKTVLELLRLAARKNAPEAVFVSVTNTGASFLFGEDELVETKLVDGTFPDYNRVIPTGNDRRFSIMPSLLTEAITQASAVSARNVKSVCLTLEDGLAVVSCSDPEFGRAEMTVPADTEGFFEIGFNRSYLLEILAKIEGRAQFDFAEPGSPTPITDSKDPNVLFVLMPMRV